MIYVTIFLLSCFCLVFAFYLLSNLRGSTGDDVQIYREQLDEIGRDLALGTLSQDQAAASKLEIQRRILRVKVDKASLSENENYFGLLAIVPVLAAVAYLYLGRVDLPVQPFFDRPEQNRNDFNTRSTEEINSLIEQLQLRLESEPNGGTTRGWTLLAQTLYEQERFGEAIDAYDHILDRPNLPAGLYTRALEAHIAHQNGFISQRSVGLLNQAKSLEPNLPAVAFYEALYFYQQGKNEAAFERLKSRVQQENGFLGWMPSFADLAQDIADDSNFEMFDLPSPLLPPNFETGPTQADIEAAQNMTQSERREMIEGMVNQLAERLRQEPDNINGWLRLGEVNLVLKKNDEAKEAFNHVITLLKNNQNDPRYIKAREELNRINFAQ